MFKNEYVLSVDLKKKMTALVPTFVQNDTASLVFKIFDNGKPFDLTDFTRAEVSHKRGDGQVVIGLASIEGVVGDYSVRYEYMGNEMSREGFAETSITLFSGDTRVSIQPFKINIVTDIRDAIGASQQYGIFQDMIAETHEISNIAIQATEEAIVAKNETLAVKDAAEAVRVATEAVRVATDVVKSDTEIVKDATEIVKDATEAVRVATNQVKADTETVKVTTDEVRSDTLQAKSDTELATSDANTATQQAIQATSDAQTVADNTIYVEDYNATTQYKKNNFVSFNGSTYMAKLDSKDIAPPALPTTSNANWVLSGRKGADGTGTVVRHRDAFIASEGQTIFTLSNSYDQLQNRIDGEVGGVPQFSPDNFIESSSTSVTLTQGVPAGTMVIFTYFSEAQPLREDLDAVINNHTTTINDHETRIDIIEETPIAQGKMGLDVVASVAGKAVRWNEFSLKHNNDGTFKGIDQVDMNLTTSATATKKPVRWDEFSAKHNNDGTFKANVITNTEIGLLSPAIAAGDAIRWDEFSNKHNNDGSLKTGVITNAEINLSTLALVTGNAIRWDEFSVKHNNDGSLKPGSVGAVDIADKSITNEKLSDTAGIASTKLAIQKMYKKSPSPAVSVTIDTFGALIDLTPSTGYVSLVPQLFEIVFGGTFGAETITADITVTFSDATTANLLKTATEVGTVAITSSELMSLIKDGVYINKISVKSKSSIYSSIATITVNHYGFYL